MMFKASKDGGPDSTVWMYGIEIKWLFSILLLRFEDGSRDAYHSHAFDCVSWVLRGELFEQFRARAPNRYRPSWRPIITRTYDFHKVTSIGRTWVLTFRGPWGRTWQEHIPGGDTYTLERGRRRVST